MNRSFLERSRNQTVAQIFHYTFDKFKWPCCEWSLLWICVCSYSFDCLAVHKAVRCTNRTEIKDWLQYTNKKLLLPGDIIIYTLGFGNELELHFLNHFVFLMLYIYAAARTTIPWKQMFLNSKNIKGGNW